MRSRARRVGDVRRAYARRLVVGLLVLPIAAGCNASGQSQDSSAAAPLSEATRLGSLAERDLAEASGLVPSTREPGVFWANNDSGNDERLFAFDTTGAALGAVRVAGANNRDWEAMAAGPCPLGSCLYVGDVGDNLSRHKTIRVIRIAEPLATDTVSSEAQILTVQYPDGATDVESIWVTPDTAVYFLTKRHVADGQGGFRAIRLFRVPASAWASSEVITADFVDSLPITPTSRDKRTWVTDAALSHPDSTGTRRLAVRSYSDVFVFDVDSVTFVPTELVAHCSLAPLKQGSRGEGVTWLPDGRLLFHAEGEGAHLGVGRCP